MFELFLFKKFQLQFLMSNTIDTHFDMKEFINSMSNQRFQNELTIIITKLVNERIKPVIEKIDYFEVKLNNLSQRYLIQREI